MFRNLEITLLARRLHSETRVDKHMITSPTDSAEHLLEVERLQSATLKYDPKIWSQDFPPKEL